MQEGINSGVEYVYPPANVVGDPRWLLTNMREMTCGDKGNAFVPRDAIYYKSFPGQKCLSLPRLPFLL